ncbi:MAG: peptide chain release factor N(5)-glutamine methyltransferase [Treponema sp.]|nr:peptide chain release factor N(5)-glutamine methyltransferase [Treponema sp.]
MTIRETLAQGKRLLQAPSPSSCIDTPALDAALLLGEVLGMGRAGLILHEHDPVTDAERERYMGLVSRRRGGECTAYILGRREFRGLDFTVNPSVLVPRPDTETLVEAALEYIDGRGGAGPLALLDLCTGSGALAISLKSERPFLQVTASDICAGALETGRGNAQGILGPDSIRFIQSDLFQNIHGAFDIIVSNPPYIPSGELSALPPEVRREPHLALDGGGDGLELVRKIIARSPRHLSPGGILLLEAGSGQMPEIRSLLEAGGFGGVSARKDLAGRDRVISCRRSGE